MNFDYQQTQAEITYQMVGIGDWAFKKIAALGSADVNAGQKMNNSPHTARKWEMRAGPSYL